MTDAELLAVWSDAVARLPVRLRAVVVEADLHPAPGGDVLAVVFAWRWRTFHYVRALAEIDELRQALATEAGRAIDVVVVLLPERAEVEPRRASFSRWLRRQRRRDDAVGDLARDVREDPDWPGRTLRTMHNYLLDVGACDGANDALHAAWAEWSAPHTRRTG